MSAPVRTEVVEQTLVITIDRPQVRNAIDGETARGIADALDRLDADRALRVGVLTGANGTFCAGMDLRAALNGESPDVPGRGFGGLTEAAVAKPLIAAVEGHALGGGFELALACDLIVAADGADFGFPEVKRGLIAAGGGVLRLPHRIPYHLAMELLLTGNPVTAQRASELGLVNRLVSVGGALDAALELAGLLAVNAPLALAAVKHVVRASVHGSEQEALAAQRERMAALSTSADVREGMTAFTQRRDPVWQGR